MSISRRMLVAAVLVGGLAVAVPAAAPARGGDRDHGARYDRSYSWPAPARISAPEFLARAAAANQFEIVTGRLAQERAQSSEVRALGAQFVVHHTALLQQGNAVAAQLGIAVTPVLDREQRRAVELLQRLSGRAFDRVWLLVQLKAHQEALALHLRGALRGDRPEIRALALGGLPVVTQHYAELLDLVGGRYGARHGHDRD